MSRDDSDSSDAEDDDYTETGVLLGYASKEPTEDNISQLGGYPTWLDPSTPPPLDFAKCKVCNDLMSLLLQLNGDLPEHFPGHERRLYLFTCRRRTCQRKQGSVRGFRGVRVNPIQETAKSKGKGKDQPDREAQSTKTTQQNIGDSIFGTKATPNTNGNPNPFSSSLSENANPFSPPADTTANTNPFATGTTPLPNPSTLSSKPPQRPTPTEDLPATFAQKARISTPSPPPQNLPPPPTDPWPPQPSFPTPYPTYHLDADYETISKPATPPLPTSHPDMSFDDNAPTTSSKAASDDTDPDQAFESTLDKPFLRFADRLAQNPLQVLRYDFRGSPLLQSKSDAVGKLFSPQTSTPGGANAKITVATSSGPGKTAGMPRCGNCGALRVFEVQLVPGAIAELEGGEGEGGLEGMEWGTVVLGVCGRDCAATGVRAGGVGYVEEWVGVQWEERVGGGGGGVAGRR